MSERKSYSELLRDPRWQRRRLEILNRANFACERCHDKTQTLHVHHKLNRKGAAPWDYSDSELQALCETCHESEHATCELISRGLAELDPERLAQVLGFLEGLIAQVSSSPKSRKITVF